MIVRTVAGARRRRSAPRFVVLLFAVVALLAGGGAGALAAPAEAPTVDLTQPTTTSVVESTVYLTATMSVDSADYTVGFAITAGPHKDTPLGSARNGAVFTTSYTGTTVGTDTIKAYVYSTGPHIHGTRADVLARVSSNAVDHTWVQPTITLSPNGSTAPTGTAHTVQASVTDDLGGSVRFTVISGPNAEQGAFVDGPPYTWTYTSNDEPGQDVITGGYFPPGWEGPATTDRVTHTWEQPTITLTPDGTTDAIRTQHTVTAEMTGPYDAVQFTVVDGPNRGSTSVDDSSPYQATYTSEKAGVDTIEATMLNVDGAPVGTPVRVTHTWVLPVYDVGLGPDATVSCVNTPFDLTVTAGRGEGAAGGLAVRVLGRLPGQPDRTEIVTTGEDGRATVPITRGAAGTETLTPDVPDAVVQGDPITHVWRNCGGLRVELQPAGTSGVVGSPFTATVTVRDADGVVANAEVTFQATMKGGENRRAVVRTDDAGIASSTYTRRLAGSDEITATVLSGDRRGVASIAHRWRAEPGLGVTLNPAGTTGLTGSPFTATVLVTNGTRPVPAAQVRFRATMTGQRDVLRTARTDRDGQASFPYTRPAAGTDRVTADVRTGSRRGQAAIAHVWSSVPRLGLALDPAGAASRVGAGFVATATFTDRGRPVAGTAVAFRSTMPGQRDITGSGVTDRAGRAAFRYSRSAIGPDTVTATASVGGRDATATIAHLWRNLKQVAPTVTGQLTLDRPATLPGGSAMASGGGCPPRSDVTLRMAGAVVGAVAAGPEGGYVTALRVPRLGVGRYTVRALCGGTTTQTTLDLVVTTSASGTAGAAAATVGAVLVFFALLGGQFLRPR